MRHQTTLFLLVLNRKSKALGLYGVIKLHQFLLVQDVSWVVFHPTPEGHNTLKIFWIFRVLLVGFQTSHYFL